MPLPAPELARAFRAAREHSPLLHLDTAACGLMSRAARRAAAEHLRAEATRGGYVAAAQAEPLLRQGRDDLAALLGSGLTGNDVVVRDGAYDELVRLVDAWPLPRGARVGIARPEYGPNRAYLADRVGRCGGTLVELPVDPATGVLELGELDVTDLHLVVVSHVASQNPAVQPARELASICRTAGVPLVLDVAQSLGQVDCTDLDADAYVGTARKWLHGPRGVGFVAVRPAVAARLRVVPLPLGPQWDGRSAAQVPAGAARFAGLEVPVALHAAFAVAVAEHRALGTVAVERRLRALAVLGRELLAVAGLRPTAGSLAGAGTVVLHREHLDWPGALALRRRLLDAGVLVSAIPVSRAPADLAAPVLRISLHPAVTERGLQRAAAALASAG